MTSAFGDIIRHWRDIRRFSQLSLSTETGISSRHISFLETGRSKPSRNSIMTLARALDMPKKSVNDALLAAGFAPEYRAHSLDHNDLQPAMGAIENILNNHEPLPAIVIDGAWNIINGNAAAQAMIQILPFHGSSCVVDALINDDPDDPIFLNWSVIAAWTALRLQHEIMQSGGREELNALYDKLANDPRLKAEDINSFSNFGPILTMNAKFNDQTLTFFTMMVEFSTVQDITLSELRVELFFPGDDTTKQFFEVMA